MTAPSNDEPPPTYSYDHSVYTTTGASQNVQKNARGATIALITLVAAHFAFSGLAPNAQSGYRGRTIDRRIPAHPCRSHGGGELVVHPQQRQHSPRTSRSNSTLTLIGAGLIGLGSLVLALSGKGIGWVLAGLGLGAAVWQLTIITRQR